ncbi:MAG: hypothetical protein P4M14_04995 [Gammaproteobacteria bacterium]|nr:hypothetical protein [Gammaproteobacteria bacterium]
MKVKCINIYNENTKQFEQSSYWLTIGKEYVVLEMKIYPGKNILYRLIGDNINKSPGMYNAAQFEVASEKISSRWKISQLKSGSLSLSPESWQRIGFWEECYDLDPQALEVYKCEAQIILEEENSFNN